MRILLIIAHGSRREVSNDEVRDLGARVRFQAGKGFDDVRTAFLELASPSIAEELDECARLGATEIVIVPYFLAAGRHVVVDLPAAVNAFQENSPGVSIKVAGHLGTSDALARAILELASDTAERSHQARDRDSP